MTWIQPIYMFTAIFGGGIILVDLLGSLTSASGNEDGDADAEVGDAADDGVAEDADGDTGSEEGDGESHEHGSYVSHNKEVVGSKLLKVMAALRSMVYFAFGFGVVGWFAVGTGKGALISMLWSIPVGLLFAVTARFLKRLQRHELDSQIRNSELILSQAKVIVSIKKGEMGKIRISLGGVQVDRYARAKNLNDEFPVGETVTVAEVSDEYLTVEQSI